KPTDDPAATPTASGNLIGTPDYMSPEQCRGEPVGPESDIYSLGATYYALLTGRPPFRGDSLYQVMDGHCSGPIPDPRLLAPSISPACSAIVRRSMAKQPGERYSGAGQMLTALETALSGQELAESSGPDSLIPRLDGTSRRRAVRSRRVLAIVGVAL